VSALLYSELLERVPKLRGCLYKKYQSLEGKWCDKHFHLTLADAPASAEGPAATFKMWAPHARNGFPPALFQNRNTRIALGDFLLRRFEKLVKKISHPSGPGNGGRFYSDLCGPEMLERSSFVIDAQGIELRFRYGLPAHGNRVDVDSFLKALELGFPKIVSEILTWKIADEQEIWDHIHHFEDQEILREHVCRAGFVAFVPQGAILPRAEQGSTEPLADAIPFQYPPHLEKIFTLPHRGSIRGLAIPCGVTMITGAGFHGKSTLLHAIEMGIYNHIPKDGRAFVVTDPSVFKIHVEEGRFAEGIDLSSYIRNLPLKKSSEFFSSKQCSGSTSQAASVIESLRMGCRCLLFDDDTSATNFLFCDAQMKALIGTKDRTIFPFLESAQDLFKKKRVSSILVAGSSSAYFPAADLILNLSSYRVEDKTEDAKTLTENNNVLSESFDTKPLQGPRLLEQGTFRIRKRKNPFKTRVLASGKIEVGSFVLDFSNNVHLVDITQTRFFHKLLLEFEKIVFQKSISIEKAIQELFTPLQKEGIESFCIGEGGMSQIRALDFAHALNRFRLLKVRLKAEG
jgi:hypothetical protein